MHNSDPAENWIICLFFIIAGLGDLCYVLFWVRPRYEEFMIKYRDFGDDLLPGRNYVNFRIYWHRHPMSRQDWKEMIITRSVLDVTVFLCGILFLLMLP